MTTAPAPVSRPAVRVLRRLGINLAVLAAALGAAALLAELLVRLVAPQQLILIRPDLWQPSDTLGWVHRPNVATTVNTGERTVSFYTDRDGYRVGREGRAEADTRVLLLGDSFMEALQVEHEQTAAHLLQTELSRRPQTPVVVRNAGVVGWNTNHYHLRAQQALAQERFALVVVALFVGNDAISARMERFPARKPVERNPLRLPRSLRRGELVSAWLAPVNDLLEVRSQAYVLLKNRLSTLRMRLGLVEAYFPREYQRAEVGSPRWPLTAEVAGDIADAAARAGARTLFVLVPESFQVYEEVFQRHVKGYGVDTATVDLEQPTRRLLEELSSRKLETLDALPAFRAARGGAPLFGTVDTHLAPAGHQLLATLIARRAQTLLAPPERPAPAPNSTGTP